MKVWLRRILYTFIVFLWLIVMSLPIVMFVLGARGELQFGSTPQNHLRLFLVREEEADGVGFQWTRRVSGQTECSRTTVVYWVWEGKQQDTVQYCQCFDANGNANGTVCHET